MQATSSVKQNKLIAKNFLVSEGNVDEISKAAIPCGSERVPQLGGTITSQKTGSNNAKKPKSLWHKCIFNAYWWKRSY